jgi:hypothetical protein
MLRAGPSRHVGWDEEPKTSAIGGGELELRAGVELPVDNVALPQAKLDLLPGRLPGSPVPV